MIFFRKIVNEVAFYLYGGFKLRLMNHKNFPTLIFAIMIGLAIILLLNLLLFGR